MQTRFIPIDNMAQLGAIISQLTGAPIGGEARVEIGVAAQDEADKTVMDHLREEHDMVIAAISEDLEALDEVLTYVSQSIARMSAARDLALKGEYAQATDLIEEMPVKISKRLMKLQRAISEHRQAGETGPVADVAEEEPRPAETITTESNPCKCPACDPATGLGPILESLSAAGLPVSEMVDLGGGAYALRVSR